ncbi:MAG TPA: DUF3459 domain-containing protein, partial [Candidatus Limnocylindrales bacterium]
HEVGGNPRAAGLAAALLFALPGAVSIYYGDEVGMSGAKEPASRMGMVWDERRQDRQMLELYRRLGRLRRSAPALHGAEYRRLAEDGAVVAFGRGDGADRLVVAANAGQSEARLPADALADWLDGRPRVSGTFGYDDGRASVNGDAVRVPPQSVAVLTGQRTKGGKT